jgi:hypothetical protein
MYLSVSLTKIRHPSQIEASKRARLRVADYLSRLSPGPDYTGGYEHFNERLPQQF